MHESVTDHDFIIMLLNIDAEPCMNQTNVCMLQEELQYITIAALSVISKSVLHQFPCIIIILAHS